MKNKQTRLGGIFVLLFLLWAGWVVLHEGKLSYAQGDLNWTNRDGYTEFDFNLRNRTAHDLSLILQVTLGIYTWEGTSPPTKEFTRVRNIGSKQIEVLIPASEEVLGFV